jgi:hypothetical protein
MKLAGEQEFENTYYVVKLGSKHIGFSKKFDTPKLKYEHG